MSPLLLVHSGKSLIDDAGRFDFAQHYATHDYMEFTIPASQESDYKMPAPYLHIWPRREHMLIALPNQVSNSSRHTSLLTDRGQDKTFTVTLFAPHELFEEMRRPAKDGDEAPVISLFRKEFPDALEMIGEAGVLRCWQRNPVDGLVTTQVSPHHHDGKVLLLGDASHAMVPFYGQGMNCGFEDAVELADLLQDAGNDFATAFAEFQQRRKPNADAIAAMALENYVEMRDSVADAHFLLMRALERQLATRHPNRFVPRYWMVTFSRLPYAVAFQRGEIQSGILREITVGKTEFAQVDLALADRMVDERLPPLPS